MFKILVLLLFGVVCLLGLDSAGVLSLGWVKPNSAVMEVAFSVKGKNQKLFPDLTNLKLIDLNGERVFLKNFKDKIIIINFWASWCEPCKEEFPAILKLIDSFKGEVVLLAISNDFNKSKARSFLQAFIKEYPNSANFVYEFWDKNSKITQEVFKTIKLPESLIFGKNLKLETKIVGSKKWLSGEVEKIIKKLL